MNHVSKENKISNEVRDNLNRIIEIRRLKIGFIIVILIGTFFIACQSAILINQNWYNAARQRVIIDYNKGIINYDEFEAKQDKLELNLYVNLWTISILSTVAKILLNIAFTFIIICLLSIVLNKSFNKKMRRLALGLAGIILLFIMYPIFISSATIIYYIF